MMKAGIVSAMFLMSSGGAQADQYDDMTSYLKFMNTPIEILHDAENQSDFIAFSSSPVVNGGVIIHEARVDYSLGILCEWNLFIKEGENQIQNIRCLEEGDKAPPWFSSYLASATKTLMFPKYTFDTVMHLDDLGKIFEGAVVTDNFGEGFMTVKTWNLPDNEVCIKIGRDFDLMSNEILTADLRCHKILNTDYRDSLMHMMGIHPA